MIAIKNPYIIEKAGHLAIWQPIIYGYQNYIIKENIFKHKSEFSIIGDINEQK